jgi:hypothetical protein
MNFFLEVSGGLDDAQLNTVADALAGCGFTDGSQPLDQVDRISVIGEERAVTIT